LSSNPKTKILSTDIVAEYNPDIVDDICNSKIEDKSYDAIYCDAILEHVEDYWKAMENIYRILKPGGEFFIYVPFFWCFHDQTDYHRFTFTELNRMLGIFREHKIFLPDDRGYGGVLWQVLSFHQIWQYPNLWTLLSRITNTLLLIPLTAVFMLGRGKADNPNISFKDYVFYYTYLYSNHGFCGWAIK